MKPRTIIIAAVVLFASLAPTAYSQKVGFISSETIRDKFPEAKQAEQRVQSIVEEWKRELEALQRQLEALQFEISKNRLVWSDAERVEKEKELEQLKMQREAFARAKFEAGGEYDQIVRQLMTPIEEKIYAAVQEIAANESYDIILDKSLQPLPYVNFKFDMTVKVLRRLGVDVEALEKELKEKIDSDPRNKTKETKQPRRRSRTGVEEEEKQEPPQTEQESKDKQFDRTPDRRSPQNVLDKEDPARKPQDLIPPVPLPTDSTGKR